MKEEGDETVEIFPIRKGDDGLSEPFPRECCWTRYQQILSRSDETVQVAWTETSTESLRSHAQGNLLPNAEEESNPLPDDVQFGKDL